MTRFIFNGTIQKEKRFIFNGIEGVHTREKWRKKVKSQIINIFFLINMLKRNASVMVERRK